MLDSRTRFSSSSGTMDTACDDCDCSYCADFPWALTRRDRRRDKPVKRSTFRPEPLPGRPPWGTHGGISAPLLRWHDNRTVDQAACQSGTPKWWTPKAVAAVPGSGTAGATTGCGLFPARPAATKRREAPAAITPGTTKRRPLKLQVRFGLLIMRDGRDRRILRTQAPLLVRRPLAVKCGYKKRIKGASRRG